MTEQNISYSLQTRDYIGCNSVSNLHSPGRAISVVGLAWPMRSIYNFNALLSLLQSKSDIFPL